MGYEKEREPSASTKVVCVVEATDANGSVISRDGYATQAEGDAQAARLREAGFTVVQTVAEADSTPYGGARRET